MDSWLGVSGMRLRDDQGLSIILGLDLGLGVRVYKGLKFNLNLAC